MKKFLFVTVLILVLASCKKEYTCQCTIGGDVVYSTTNIKDTKKNATEKCDEKDDEVEQIECSIQ